jgi:hypothetical protein
MWTHGRPRILLPDDQAQVLANLSGLTDEAGEVVGAVQDGWAATIRAVLAGQRFVSPELRDRCPQS